MRLVVLVSDGDLGRHANGCGGIWRRWTLGARGVGALVRFPLIVKPERGQSLVSSWSSGYHVGLSKEILVTATMDC